MNPLALILLSAHYAGLLNAFKQIGKLSEDKAREALELLIGYEGEATYQVCFDLTPDRLQERALTLGIRFSPIMSMKLAGIARLLDLSVPVVEWEGEILLPYTIQDDKIEMAKYRSEWYPPEADDSIMIGKPEPTNFGLNPYHALMTGPETKFIDVGGAKLPSTDRLIVKRVGVVHPWFEEFLAGRGSGKYVLVVGTLLHEPDYKRFTNGVPETAFALLANPTNFGLSRVTVQRIVEASDTFWQKCWNAYEALMIERRRSTTVSAQQPSPPPAYVQVAPAVGVSGDAVPALIELVSKAFIGDEMRSLFWAYNSSLPGSTTSTVGVATALVGLLERKGDLTSPQTWDIFIEARPRRWDEFMEIGRWFIPSYEAPVKIRRQYPTGEFGRPRKFPVS